MTALGIRGKLPANLLEAALEMADGMTEYDRNFKPKWGQDLRKTPQQRREGTVAEFGVRQLLGIRQPEKPYDYDALFDNKGDADVGETLEVRSTGWPNGVLPVHQGHDDIHPKIERDYCLVIVPESYRFRLVGWLPMETIRAKWDNFNPHGSRPCKCVYQHQLRSPETLVVIEDGVRYRIKQQMGLPGCTF